MCLNGTEVPSPKATELPTGIRTCVYYPNWAIYARNHFPRDLPLDQITNIFYAFFNIDHNSGEVQLSDSWADVEKDILSENHRKLKGLLASLFDIKSKHRHVKISMSIGGWSNRDCFKKAVNSERKLKCFIKSATDLLMEYGFDGIDLDWEYPENHREANTYLKMIRLLRLRLDQLEIQHILPQGSFLLTIASPAFEEKLDHFNIREMDKYLSFWNLMTYDFAGEWSDVAGYHCNLFKKSRTSSDELCADDTVKYFLSKKVNPAKLILGMANYGRSFTNTEGYGMKFHGVGFGSGDEKGIWNYNKLPFNGCEEIFDKEAVIASCFDPQNKTYVSYDNVDSVKHKAKYVSELHLGGGMWWESSGDDYKDPEKSLLHTFVNEIGGSGQLDKSLNVTTSAYKKSRYLKFQFNL